MEDLNIDWLRANCQMIHFFGLGFVQLKVSDSVRYHFYHPKWSGFTEDPHDHRYDFSAEVIRGRIKHTLWDIVEVVGEGDSFGGGISFELRFESCNKDEKHVPAGYSVRAKAIGRFVVAAGDWYWLDKDIFHQVERMGGGPLITKLVRDDPTKDHARILAPHGSDVVCPFSGNLPEAELWEIVEDCLTGYL